MLASLLLLCACTYAPQDATGSRGDDASSTSSASSTAVTTDDTDTTSTPAGTSTTDTSTTTSSTPDRPAEFIGEPTLSGPRNPDAPLVRGLTVATDEPTTLEVSLDDGETIQVLTFDESRRTHDVMLLGFRPDAAHTVAVTAVDSEGLRTSWPELLEVSTDPLPVDFPVLDVTVHEPALLEPGYTVLSLQGPIDHAVLLDNAGVIRWYARRDSDVKRIVRSPDGHLTWQEVKSRVVQFDMWGEFVGGWHAADFDHIAGSVPVPVESIHHSVAFTPEGSVLTLATRTEYFESYPSSERRPLAAWEPNTLVGDVLLELDPDGTIRRKWDTLELLDPYRFAYDSLVGDHWDRHYGMPVADWSHANGIDYDPVTDIILLSLRHQDAIVALERTTGEIAWISGPHANWVPPWSELLLEPVGEPFHWHYHQHDPVFTDAGTFLVYDNGKHRASPFDPKLGWPDTWSRLVEYRVDPLAETIEQVWAFAPEVDPPAFSSSQGNSFFLPTTGNALGCFSNLSRVPYDYEAPGATVYQVTRDDPAVVVMEVSSPTNIRRASHLPTLYP